jgi:magnesium transporter
VVLKVIYRSVQHFIEHLKVINMISGELELQISRAMENTNLIHMFMLEKSLVYYLSAIQANGAIIERLRLNASNPATPGFTPENLEFIDDLAIENKQCYELTRIYSDILAGMMDARASIVNNNLNLLMKTLTVFMLAIMWPPLVCGFFSMNVKLPVDQTGALWPFFVVLLASFGPIAGILVYRRFLANGKSRFWRRLWRRKPA